MCLCLFVNFDVMFLPTHALSLHAAASVFMPGDKKTYRIAQRKQNTSSHKNAESCKIGYKRLPSTFAGHILQSVPRELQ